MANFNYLPTLFFVLRPTCPFAVGTALLNALTSISTSISRVQQQTNKNLNINGKACEKTWGGGTVRTPCHSLRKTVGWGLELWALKYGDRKLVATEGWWLQEVGEGNQQHTSYYPLQARRRGCINVIFNSYTRIYFDASSCSCSKWSKSRDPFGWSKSWGAAAPLAPWLRHQSVCVCACAHVFVCVCVCVKFDVL